MDTVMPRILHYDAFSSVANMGNPAGAVPEADSLTEKELQEIAKAVGFNETVFICQSRIADYCFRYFTPGCETNLCGHATIADILHLHEAGMLQNRKTLFIDTKAGVLRIEVNGRDNGVTITMAQALPQFVPYTGNIEELTASIGITPSDLDSNLPIVYGSTGSWTLLVPVKSLSAFEAMQPQTRQFPKVLEQNTHSSIHPFCFEALSAGRDIHFRHFSSPYSGTVEDPVTGTASGVIRAYCATYVNPARSEYQYIMEQGQEMGRDGEVQVHVLRAEDALRVSISGTAVYVSQLNG